MKILKYAMIFGALVLTTNSAFAATKPIPKAMQGKWVGYWSETLTQKQIRQLCIHGEGIGESGSPEDNGIWIITLKNRSIDVGAPASGGVYKPIRYSKYSATSFRAIFKTEMWSEGNLYHETEDASFTVVKNKLYYKRYENGSTYTTMLYRCP